MVTRKPITAAQLRYIDQLAIDLTIAERRRKMAHINDILIKDYKYLDELTLEEASKVIDTFKKWKDNQSEYESVTRRRLLDEEGERHEHE